MTKTQSDVIYSTILMQTFILLMLVMVTVLAMADMADHRLREKWEAKWQYKVAKCQIRFPPVLDNFAPLSHTQFLAICQDSSITPQAIFFRLAKSAWQDGYRPTGSFKWWAGLFVLSLLNIELIKSARKKFREKKPARSLANLCL